MNNAANFVSFLHDCRRFLDIYSNGPRAVAASFDRAKAFSSIAIAADTPEARSSFVPLTRRPHPAHHVVFGDPSRHLASLPDNAFDRICISEAPDFSAARTALLETCRILAGEGLILVDRCDRPHMVDAVSSGLAQSLIEPGYLPGWRPNVHQMLVRRKRSAGYQSSAKTISVSVVGDRARAEWNIAGRSITRYADRIGARLAVFDDDLGVDQRPLAKLLALERLRGRGRVLLLDTDIVIRETCPDLFDITPIDSTALFFESSCIDRTDFLVRLRRNYMISEEIPHYANTGVAMLSEPLVALLAISGAQTPIYLGPLNEQDHVNAVIQQCEAPIFPLSALFNCMPSVTPQHRNEAFIVHFAGGDAAAIHLKVLGETPEPYTGRLIYTPTALKRHDLRLPLIRNELASNGGEIDILIGAHQLWAQTSPVMRDGILRIDSRPDCALVSFGPYLQLKAGQYSIDVLLKAGEFSRALALESIDGSGAGAPADSSDLISIDLVCDLGKQVIVPPRQYNRANTVTIAFQLDHQVEDFECRVFSGGPQFSVFGYRIRSTPCRTDTIAQVDAGMLGLEDLGAVCERSLEIRWAERIQSASNQHKLPRPLIVSLTSYPARFHSLLHVLKCILTQTVKPDRIVLWLAPTDLAELPEHIRLLEGIEIRTTDDIKAYKKSVPAFRTFPEAFVVVADDDKHYTSNWLSDLVGAYRPAERAILCHRAHRIRFDAAGSLMPYTSWDYEVEDPEMSELLFATGCGGVMFPPGLIPTDAWDENLFLRLAPYNDDIFVYCLARKHGCAIKKVSGLMQFFDLPGTQAVALAHLNRQGANDQQLAATVAHFGIDLKGARAVS